MSSGSSGSGRVRHAALLDRATQKGKPQYCPRVPQDAADRDAAARETSAILSRFGKSGWHGAATHSLSQGQKQLVCLMAVLAMRPRLIVLDEPYSGLDIPTRMQLVRYVDAVDTLYGGGAYMPMADGAEYEVWITQSGLVARPTNEAARQASSEGSTEVN